MLCYGELYEQPPPTHTNRDNNIPVTPNLPDTAITDPTDMASEGKTGGVVMSWLSTIFGIVQPLLGFEDAGKTSTKIDFTASRYTGSTMGAGDSKVLEDRNDDARLLNEGSLGVSAGVLPAFSDVVVVGAGIHSLIYAIHTRKLEEVNLPGKYTTPPPITYRVYQSLTHPQMALLHAP